MVRYSLTFSCKNLYEEAFSKSDPYIKLLLNGVTLGRTETIANAKSPHFQRAIEVNAHPSEQIQLKVYDDDFGVSNDDFLGECYFDLGMLDRDYDKKIKIHLRRYGRETSQAVTIYGKQIMDPVKPISTATSYTSAPAPPPTTHVYIQLPQGQQAYVPAQPAYAQSQYAPPIAQAPSFQYAQPPAQPPAQPQYAPQYQAPSFQYAQPPAQPQYAPQYPQPPPVPYQQQPPPSQQYTGYGATYTQGYAPHGSYTVPPPQQYAQPPAPSQPYAAAAPSYVPPQQYAGQPQQYVGAPPNYTGYSQSQPSQAYGAATSAPVAYAVPMASAPPAYPPQQGTVPAGLGQSILHNAYAGQW